MSAPLPALDTPVSVLGAGSWGTVLAMLMAREGRPVRLWARRPEMARSLQATRENEVYLPGIRFPDPLRISDDLGEVLADAELCVMAVPTRGVTELARRLAREDRVPPRVVSATKGLEPGTFATMTRVLCRELGEDCEVAALSGPNLAREIAAGQPAAAVIASEDPATARWIQEVFTSPTFRAYTSPDPIGVELGGALKNVLALAAGMLAELGLGANSQAAMLTRGLAEISRLGCALGAQPTTFHGLAGLGDVLATCSSSLSRNHRAGRMAARGLDPESIRIGLGQAVEGLTTVQVVLELARAHDVEMPISDQVHRVLYQGLPARDAARALLSRPPRPEQDGADREEVAL